MHERNGISKDDLNKIRNGEKEKIWLKRLKININNIFLNNKASTLIEAQLLSVSIRNDSSCLTRRHLRDL